MGVIEVQFTTIRVAYRRTTELQQLP